MVATQTPAPAWLPGTGAASASPAAGASVAIDPYAAGRAPADNYRLLVSGIVPRPVGFVSTVSAAGVRNLAPFSYFQVANHDPPVFTLGFSQGQGVAKDTAANLAATRECTISIVSEHFVEAANYTAIDAPAGTDEWLLSGLTPVASDAVAPPWVGESVFSVEARLLHTHDWHARATGAKSGMLAIVEGVRFHVKEKALKDGVIDPEMLRPIARLGGISYARLESRFELPRPSWAVEKERGEVKEALARAVEVEGVLKN